MKPARPSPRCATGLPAVGAAAAVPCRARSGLPGQGCFAAEAAAARLQGRIEAGPGLLFQHVSYFLAEAFTKPPKPPEFGGATGPLCVQRHGDPRFAPRARAAPHCAASRRRRRRVQVGGSWTEPSAARDASRRVDDGREGARPCVVASDWRVQFVFRSKGSADAGDGEEQRCTRQGRLAQLPCISPPVAMRRRVQRAPGGKKLQCRALMLGILFQEPSVRVGNR